MIYTEVVYHDKNMPRLEMTEKGNWCDMRVVGANNKITGEKLEIGEWKTLVYEKGDFLLLNLGVSFNMPEGYEAHVAPRSSTFKNYGFIQTNGVGVIDESYSGQNDIWFMPVYCTRSGVIDVYDRVCQFRLLRAMCNITFKEVQIINKANRGGHGSTGVK
jgi:dUTP pyrophosphatase